MKRSKIKSILSSTFAVAIAFALCAGGTKVFAADPTVTPEPTTTTPEPTTTPEIDAKVSITKQLDIAEGTTTPNATFTFDFVSTDSATPAISGVTATYTQADTDLKEKEGKHYIDKETKNIFEGVEYTHAGEYVYTVSESDTGYTLMAGDIDKMTYDKSVYELHVFVKNKTASDETFIQSAYFEATTDAAGTAIEEADQEKATQEGGTTADGNQTFKLFENIYTKKAGSTPVDPLTPDATVPSFTLEKQVAGDYGDKSKDFEFNVTLDAAGVNEVAADYKAKVGETEYVFTIAGSTASQTVTLHHGQKLVFANLPTGMKVTVNETAVEHYEAEIDMTINAVETNDIKAATTDVQTIGEKTNAVVFTNTFDDDSVTPTGIVLNNLPFIILIALGALSFAGYIVYKRKKAKNN